jgi:hypothetical protein
MHTRSVVSSFALAWVLVGARAATACTIVRPFPTEPLPTQESGQRFSFVATNDCDTLLFSVEGRRIREVPTSGAPAGPRAREYGVVLSSEQLEPLLGPDATTLTWTITGTTASGDTVELTTTNEIDVDGDGSTRTDGDNFLCDTDPTRGPAVPEVCGNDIDDDCDRLIDGDDPDAVAVSGYEDLDGDGYGGAAIESCDGGVTGLPGDCDDTDASVYPGAPELCDDARQDCSNSSWTDDDGVATFFPASGGWEDWTADLGAGALGSPAEVEIASDGELVLCRGRWFADLRVTAQDVAITGLHGSTRTTLSGGDTGHVLEVVQSGANVVATGLTMTGGNGCYGAAVTTMDVFSCSVSGAGASFTTGVSLALVDVRIEDNRPTNLAMGAVGVGYSTLTLDQTTIANNFAPGIYSYGSSVYCTGDPSSDAGVWGNTAGVFMWTYFSSDPVLFESDGCDFNGAGGRYTPRYDVRLQNDDWLWDRFLYGFDETFACDAATVTCTP